MKIEDHKLRIEAGDDYTYRFSPSPNTSIKPLLPELTLVIHAPGIASVSGAESLYISPTSPSGWPQSRHLIIGSDGKTILQLVPFNKGARHTWGYDGRSIAIQLEYPGQLVDSAPFFNKNAKLKENEYILGSAVSSSHYSQWPLYPKKQIDLLFRIASLLKKNYNITDIVGYDEVAGTGVSPHPGPAFPIIHFREKVLGSKVKSFVLQELAKPVQLLGQPNVMNSMVFTDQIPAGTPVSVLNEKDNWYLIAIIDEIAGNPWLAGWVKRNAVQVQTESKLSINGHYLVDDHGRRFQEITPHANGYKSKPPLDKPIFIVMHFTTGTKIESTISHFKNASSGVSTHLLIGRDGRVIQFLPFNKVAHHCGYSYWERLSNLNYHSIGIELDNAGLLARKNGKWLSRKIVIPDDRVEQRVSWKQYEAPDPKQWPGWEKFTNVQLKVALRVVSALKEQYSSIQDILGHEDVNINNRYDPGPLFPMSKFRKALFGRLEPDIDIFTINEVDIHLYANPIDGSKPNTNSTTYHGVVPDGSTVRVRQTDENSQMSLVSIVKLKPDNSTEKGANKKSDISEKTVGWISSNALRMMPGASNKKDDEKKGKSKKTILMKVKGNWELFKKSGQGLTPTPFVPEGPFKRGTPVRIEKLEGKWALVVVLDRSRGRAGIEGWINADMLSPEVIP